MKHKYCIVLYTPSEGEELPSVDSLLISNQPLTREEWQELIYVAADRKTDVGDILYNEDEEKILQMLEPWEIEYEREASTVGRYLARMNSDISELDFALAEY